MYNKYHDYPLNFIVDDVYVKIFLPIIFLISTQYNRTLKVFKQC